MELEKEARAALQKKQEAYRLLSLEYHEQLRRYTLELDIANRQRQAIEAQITAAEAATTVDTVLVGNLRDQLTLINVPVAPTAPDVPVAEDVPKFNLPSILLGSLYLTMTGASIEIQQNLIRNSHGSAHLETIEKKRPKYDTSYNVQDIAEDDFPEEEERR